MQTPDQYFSHFKKHNKYPFNPYQCYDYEEEFEFLADHMRWFGFDYDSNRSKFMKILQQNDFPKEKSAKAKDSYDDDAEAYDEEEYEEREYYENTKYDEEEDEENDNYDEDEKQDDDENEDEDEDENRDSEYSEFEEDDEDYEEEEYEDDVDGGIWRKGDDFDTSLCHKIEDYFDYFKVNYGFKYRHIKNAAALFDQLANFMNWNKNFKEMTFRLKRKKEEKDKIEFVINLFVKNRLGPRYDEKKDPYTNLYFLSKKLGWNEEYDEEREIFDELVGRLAKGKFRTLEKVHEIFKRYKMEDLLHPLIRNSIYKCRLCLKKHLFVNIYDFVAHSNRKFKDLMSLKKYSTENNRLYPLRAAKKDKILKILLHVFFEDSDS